MMIAGQSVGKGERAYTAMRVTTLASGQELRIPVHLIKGTERGPTISLISGLHGDESLSFELFSRFLEMLSPARLAGSVIVIPMANPLAMEALTRNTPVDMLDLNRNFPGRAEGWLTEKIANVITQEVVKKSDYLIDFHTAPPFQCVDYCFVDSFRPKVGPESLRISRSFGHRLVYECREIPTTLTYTALNLGIPCITSETGDASSVGSAYAESVSRKILDVLVELDMLKGGAESRGRVKRVRQLVFPEEGYAQLRPACGGVIVPNKKVCAVGRRVKRREYLATISSPYSFETLETMKSPFEDSVIFMYRMRSAIRPGDYSFIVGDYSKSRVA